MFCSNKEPIGNLIKKIREEFGDSKTIWMYTGSYWKDIKDIPFISLIDVIVDGPFIIEQRDVSLQWKGSANQRVINVKET